jgi:hypothetical protein
VRHLLAVAAVLVALVPRALDRAVGHRQRDAQAARVRVRIAVVDTERAKIWLSSFECAASVPIAVTRPAAAS